MGRSDPLALLAAAAAGARAGTPVTVSVEGPAGSGKTELVRHALDALGGNPVVVRLEAEELAGARSVVVDRLIDVPPAANGFDVGVALVEHLAEMAGDQLLVLVVEDLHWADLLTRQALAILGRRLEHEPILVIVTARPDHLGVDDGWARLRADTARCHRVQVDALTAADVTDLAAAGGIQLSAAAAQRIVTHTAGNALYVQMLLTEFPASVLVATSGRLPVPPTLAAVAVAAVADLSESAVDLIAGLAVLNTAASLPLLSEVVGMQELGNAAMEATRSGFVRCSMDGATYEMAHPLFGRAVYDDLAPSRRSALHLAAARVVDRSSALAHRVAAAEMFDETLADELASAALAASSMEYTDRAEPVQLWRWSARLTADRDLRERRVLSAARACLATDRAVPADLMAEVTACSESRLRDLVIGQQAWRDGHIAESERRLRSATTSDDPDVAGDALVSLSGIYVIRGLGDTAVDAASAALAMDLSNVRLRRQAIGFHAMGIGMRDGAFAALESLRLALPRSASTTPQPDVPLLSTRGTLAAFAGHANAAIDDLLTVVRQSGSGMPMLARRRAHVDAAQCLAVVGRWDEAVVHARIAIDLADDDHPVDRAQATQVLVGIHAARAEWDDAESLAGAVAAMARELPTPGTVLAARIAQLSLLLARDDHAAVVAATPLPMRPPMVSSLLLSHPAAAARIAVGELEVAAALVEQFEADAAIRRLDASMRIADLRGRLAARSGDAERALAAYTLAVASITPDSSILEIAGVRLAFGRLLRTAGKRHQALEQLAEARTVLEGVGATAYIERVDAELAKSGLGKPRQRRRSPLDLTDRERDVVTLAIRGLTTKQVAAELYVSPKAVEYHLGNVYGKLGISSRQELRERMATM